MGFSRISISSFQFRKKQIFTIFSCHETKDNELFFFQYLEYIMDISRYFHVNSTIRSVCFFTKRRNFSKITEFLHCPTCKIRDCAFNKLMRCKRIRAFSSSSDGERRIKNETMRHKWYAIKKNILPSLPLASSSMQLKALDLARIEKVYRHFLTCCKKEFQIDFNIKPQVPM